MVRSEPTAELSLADLRALSRLGIAIAAMIRMIATTMSNSMSEKPFCFVMRPPPREVLLVRSVIGDLQGTGGRSRSLIGARGKTGRGDQPRVRFQRRVPSGALSLLLLPARS